MRQLKIIITFFSVVTEDVPYYWKFKDKININNYKDIIHDDKRLEERFIIFINCQLPLIEQLKISDDVEQFVICDYRLPHKYISKLKKLCENKNFLNLIMIKSYCELKDKIIKNIKSKYDNDIILSVTLLSDDDILHPIFMKDLNEFLRKEYINFCVSHSCGYCGFFENGRYKKFFEYESFNNSQGLTYITYVKNGVLQTKYLLPPGTSNVDLTVPVITIGTNRLFIYTIHKSNDYLKLFKGMDTKEIINKIVGNRINMNYIKEIFNLNI